ncbi:MAG: GNAT family N-acetyltransferase [Devosia sp.]|uniref:GNAT family N-acetyltransferase n=1 Tax=Devosia sp. TaxID=1871048 RepID=UPI0024C9DF32|nr:GNAT family N-acetyltransferase [Devosia sp.]UYN99145.1 MAG: GNAT family N-acetyltransferase [Devosia sp.]
MADGLAFAVTEHPEAADLDRLSQHLGDFNAADAGPSNRRALAVFVRNSASQMVAGLSGYTAWGWLYVQWLWVGENQRGLGLAAQMLAAAETEARARGCHGAYIDTFNPTALKVYQRAGYGVFGQLRDFPMGRTRSFLSKALS